MPRSERPEERVLPIRHRKAEPTFLEALAALLSRLLTRRSSSDV